MPCSRARPTKMRPAATNTNRNTRRPPVRIHPILGMVGEDSGMQLLWVAVGLGVTAVVARGSRDALTAPVLQRKNFAGRDIATAGGILAVVGFLVAMAIRVA